jgi:hypothetical protein
VEDALAVGGGQAGAQLPRHPHRAILREAAYAAEKRRQVLAVHVLHGQEVLAIDLSRVPHAAHVGVGHLAGQAHLFQEAAAAIRVLAEGRREELQGHRLAELQVVRPVDLTHSTAAQG